MGLGLMLAAPAAQLKKRDWPALGTAIGDFARQGLNSLEAYFTKVHGGKDILEISRHPFEENVEFSIDKRSGALVVSAKTNSVGPGYHADLVDWLDRLAQQLNITWGPVDIDDPSDSGDETGYMEQRDYSELQRQMGAWLNAMAKDLCADKFGSSGVYVSMAMNAPRLLEPYFAVSPMGFWEWSWFEQFLEIKGNAREAMCRQFFPWWNRGKDGLYWRNLGVGLMQNSIQWHAPNSDEEENLYRHTLQCFQTAKRLDAKVSLPTEEITELEKILEHCNPLAMPATQGIGLYRKEIKHRSIGGWTLQLPGYYNQRFTEDPFTHEFGFGGREVYLSAYSRKNQEGKDETPEQILAGLKSYPTEGKITFVNKQFQGQAFIAEKVNESGQRHFLVRSVMATLGRMAHMTLVYTEPSDEEWALSTWRSLSAP